jgi:hypothetical protein
MTAELIVPVVCVHNGICSAWGANTGPRTSLKLLPKRTGPEVKANKP